LRVHFDTSVTVCEACAETDWSDIDCAGAGLGGGCVCACATPAPSNETTSGIMIVREQSIVISSKKYARLELSIPSARDSSNPYQLEPISTRTHDNAWGRKSFAKMLPRENAAPTSE
jgi:hypothetical protein